MKKRISKIIFIVVLLCLLYMIFNIVYATSDLTNSVRIELPQSNEIVDAGNSIAGIVKTVGILVSVIALIIIGIRYMFTSIEQRAEYKKTFQLYIVGALLVFAIASFAEKIYNIMQGIL